MNIKTALWFSLLCVLGVSSVPPRAAAQLRQGDLRLSLDVDVLTVGWVKLVPAGPAPTRKHTIVGLGPNQLGNSEVAIPSAPLGFGAGYVLRPKWLLGVRAGFGYDHVSAAAGDAAFRYLTWTFMPGVSYVPFGERAKFFVNFSPLLEYVRQKQGGAQRARFGGCYSLGAGEMWFLTPSASVDMGFYFEGRFPDIDEKPKAKTSISDLRWLLRVGLSLWT